MKTDPLAIMVTAEDGCVRMHLTGELCTFTAPSVIKAVADAFRAPVFAFVMDLRAVTFADVAGLRSLVLAAATADVESAAFLLWNIPEQLARTIRVAGFTGLLGSRESRGSDAGHSAVIR